jgi:broad specificity phosphatase PhoE
VAQTGKELLHPEEAITSLLLIRHGHTAATEAGRLYTDPEAQLTDQGIEQAKAVANWLVKTKPDVVISNRFKRVKATSDIICGALDVQPIYVDGFDEWKVGDWEGRTYLDIKKNDPQLYEAWSQDPISHRPPGGESIVDLCDRIKDRLLETIITHKGKTVAMVSHAGIIRATIVYALGMSVHNFWRISVPVGSVSLVDFSDSFATVHYLSFRPDM